MARSKKTRKVGQIGVRKAPKEPGSQPRSPSGGKPKKKTGNPSGSRHSTKQDTKAPIQNQKKDPRVGSKKPVPLVVKEVEKKVPKPKYFSPKQELAAIEADARLEALLDKIEDQAVLSVEEQQYVDQKMQRHRALCELLGIHDDADDNDDVDGDDDDPLARFESIDPKKLV
ncbi:Der GTPase-activating protein YihI [Aestuariibacter sp. AA17]|uniref:Der GTPase-activating protein YihI n=1 Tax=Fluctibacter corallii TaxID=2984329 RepID=A0ABT3ACZ7_9ALTE|nr:Der GTPase-activating protein YihI [Aestuariibacter sp. AA17]MCV2886553.1 Der GTPase-activating protein YihI [Aestuariibacter sp. AA17]